MKVIHTANELDTGGKRVCAAIGVFDGVHLGHQQVLRQTLSDAGRLEGIPLAITFDQHPSRVIAPDRAPKMIHSLDRKVEAIAKLGFENILVIKFTPEFCKLPAENFINGLARDFAKLGSICVGSAFTFGHRRGGNVKLLKELGAQLDFTVHGLAAVALDGEPVSSTRIRSAISKGELDAASQMLGREYVLEGRVVQGDQLGRQLGFPTANLEATELVMPANGVYAAHVRVDGESHRAAVNIGYRPTVSGERALRVEAHLLDYEGDLYDRQLGLIFVRKLRDEQRFESMDALREQIAIDVESARKVFA